MAGGFHVTSPESPTYQRALTKSPSFSNLEFFSFCFLELFFWLIRLFPTCVLQLSLGHKPHFILSVCAEIVLFSFCFKLCSLFDAKLTVEMHKVVSPKVFMFTFSFFPTCTEIYLYFCISICKFVFPKVFVFPYLLYRNISVFLYL